MRVACVVCVCVVVCELVCVCWCVCVGLCVRMRVAIVPSIYCETRVTCNFDAVAKSVKSKKTGKKQPPTMQRGRVHIYIYIHRKE